MRIGLRQFKNRFFLISLLLISSFGPALAHNKREIRNPTDASTVNSAIVQVLKRSGSATALCSGVMVTPSAVLTAFSCASRRPRDVTVVSAGRYLSVRTVRFHKSALNAVGSFTPDLAILFLRKPAGNSVAPVLVSRPIEVSDSLTIKGYGSAGSSPGTLRTLASAVTQLGRYFFLASGAINTCNGDAGGPAINTYIDGAGLTRSGVVGIASFNTSLFCASGRPTYFSNLQSPEILDFLKRQITGLRLE